MLTALEVENFKGIGRPIRVEFRSITLLFGPNSSGKSSILHVLHYGREIFERGNVNADTTLGGGTLIDLGGFESAVHGRDRSREIRIRFDFENDGRGFPNELLYGAGDYPYEATPGIHDGLESQFRQGWVEVGVRWSEHRGAPYVARFAVGADDRLIARLECNSDGTQIRLEDIDILHPLVTYDGRGLSDENEFEERPLPTPEWQWERAATSCDTGTRSALPAWNSSLRIIRPSRTEMIQRIRSTVLPRILEMRREAVRELSIEEELPTPTAAVARSAGDQAVVEEPNLDEESDEELQREAEEIADWLDARWSSALQTRLSLLIIGIGQIVLDELRSTNYLGPLRELPDRNYAAPRSPDASRWANGLAAWDTLYRGDPKFLSEVGAWLERLGTGYSLRLEEFREVPNEGIIARFLTDTETPLDWLDSLEDMQESFKALPLRRRLFLTDSRTQLSVVPMDVGVGISQIVPVVVAALTEGEGSTKPLIAIEQPELHVHPAIQVELGDLFATSAGKSRSLLLIETHSEHVMLRLCRRIEETSSGELPPGSPELRPDQVAVFYVEGRSGEVTAERIPIDDSGEFVTRWPNGFFEERSKELF